MPPMDNGSLHSRASVQAYYAAERAILITRIEFPVIFLGLVTGNCY
jgi:hypothetical protein